ncbi:glycosyltransferase [Pseudopelagicola sp. nBUS_20]|uniref:glycosyltransferase n=1 Tax=Pseudopelagicola sp. nBUS_20 TaxID=3395317 RepID=UPI003EB7E1F9
MLKISESRATFSVVICAHTMDRIDLLSRAVASICSQSLPTKELIVVCDHNDELRSQISQKYPSILVVENSEAKGLSGARNTGLKIASGSVIAFLDDDAQASEDWLEKLARAYLDPKVMAAGGIIDPDWPDARPRWFPREFDWVVGCSYKGQPHEGGVVRNLIGCNMSVRREVATAVGGFRESLGRVGDNASGCEETDYFIRAYKLFPHRTVYFEPRAIVHHSIEKTRTTWSYFVQRCRAEGKSKASLVAFVGSSVGLSSETNYAKKVLPSGVWGGLREGLRGDVGGFFRAATICAGFLSVASSFTVGRIRSQLRSFNSARNFQPYRIIDIDLADKLPNLGCLDPKSGCLYSATWCLVRSNGQPIKILEIPFDGRDVSSEMLAEFIAADVSDLPPGPLPALTPNNQFKVSVIIATRDRADSLRRCLNSMLAQTYNNLEIVVVDNAPSDSKTKDLIDREYAQTSQVQYVCENIPGLARAHNFGVSHASGDILAFTDDDVIADPQWVSSIAANFAHSESIGCVTGMILPAELLTQAQLWTELHGGFGKGLFRRVFDLSNPSNEGPLFPYTAGAFGSGANMAFRRATLERMGGFDNALGAGTIARGGDDLASFVAALQVGDQLAYEPGAMVWHFHRREVQGMRRQAYSYGMGLGAYLTKLILNEPKTLLLLIRKLPDAFTHMFSRNSKKMARLPDNYPRKLVWTERLGILTGPPNYIRSLLREHLVRANPIESNVQSRH